MAHFHVKKKKGRPYLYVREIARVDGKPKVVSQIYLGSPERVAGLASGAETDTIKIKVEERGQVWRDRRVRSSGTTPRRGPKKTRAGGEKYLEQSRFSW